MRFGAEVRVPFKNEPQALKRNASSCIRMPVRKYIKIKTSPFFFLNVHFTTEIKSRSIGRAPDP
jgi:hypothetical protein